MPSVLPETPGLNVSLLREFKRKLIEKIESELDLEVVPFPRLVERTDQIAVEDVSKEPRCETNLIDDAKFFIGGKSENGNTFIFSVSTARYSFAEASLNFTDEDGLVVNSQSFETSEDALEGVLDIIRDLRESDS